MSNKVTGEDVRKVLRKYLPEAAVETCFDWIQHYRIRVRITHKREHLLGDYRPPQDGSSHAISINHDLNPYAFLITFTHEVAHLVCFTKHQYSVEPHGEEWKTEFKYLLAGLIHRNIFPEDIHAALLRFLKNPPATSCGDIHLAKTLSKYNTHDDGYVHLDELPYGSTFRLRNGKIFTKGEKLRKNHVCFAASDNAKYIFHPLVEVKYLG